MMARKLRYAMLLAVLFAGTGVSAGPIEELQPGHWLAIPNSQLEQVRPVANPGGLFTHIVNGWSGGVFDSARDRLVIWGGGHSDYAGNEIYAFDLNSLRWSRLTEPSPVNNSKDCNYPDGLPRSRHTYGYIVYSPLADAMISLGGSGPWRDGGGGFCSQVDAFQFGDMRWQMGFAANTPSVGNKISAWADVHPTTGDIWYRGSMSGQLAKLNIRSRTWENFPDSSTYVEIYNSPAIDPTRNILVSVGGYDGKRQLIVHDLNNPNSTPARPQTSGAVEIEGADAPGFQYDPVADRFIAWDGGASVYSLDPNTWNWSKISPAQGNSVIPENATPRGVYGRFRYVASRNVYVLLNSTDSNVYVYRLSAGEGSGPSKQPAPPRDLQ